MNNIYPDIKLQEKFNGNDYITELSTKVRIKRNKVWYIVNIKKTSFTTVNKQLQDKDAVIGIKEYTKYYTSFFVSFIKDCENTKACFDIPKDKYKLKEFLERFKESVEISNTQLKEKDRLYIKVLVEQFRIQEIL